MDGRETIGLRGYENNSLTPVNANDEQIGATIYNKFSMELRYPITLKSSASIYALAFLEAGSSYPTFKAYNPFDLISFCWCWFTCIHACIWIIRY